MAEPEKGDGPQPMLTRAGAAVVTLMSFPFGPGLVLVLFPWAITHWHSGAPYPTAALAVGYALIVVGAVVIGISFVRFPAEGGGTPFPTNPPSSRRVIVGGPYRYVRNPIYVAFVPVLVGMTLVLARPVLLVYGAVLMAALVAFVHWYEEPTMVKRFDAQYAEYRKRVPGWVPRIRPARLGADRL
jgi:protein-S-isoprenylcysteine O-methyltransferase Ste14